MEVRYMIFVSEINNCNGMNTIGVTDTKDGVEEFYPLQKLIEISKKYKIKIHGLSICSKINLNFHIKFVSTVEKYDGKTLYGDIKELTYDERILMALKELNSIINNCNSSSDLRDYIVRNCDYEYDDCYKKYEGMLILTAYRNDTFNWDIRED